MKTIKFQFPVMIFQFSQSLPHFSLAVGSDVDILYDEWQVFPASHVLGNLYNSSLWNMTGRDPAVKSLKLGEAGLSRHGFDLISWNIQFTALQGLMMHTSKKLMQVLQA